MPAPAELRAGHGLRRGFPQVTAGHPVEHLLASFERRYRQDDTLRLEQAGSDSLGSWFLGPKGENADLFRQLAIRAIDAHLTDRREFRRDDPPWVTREVKDSAAYKAGVSLLESELDRLLARLHGSVPFYSYRYQGHMLWDVTLPSLLGYLAALLYNQNNVAAEASPVTTLLEMEVGRDLCRMLGYAVPPLSEVDAPPAPGGPAIPWGHITADGSLANIESIWAMRNARYYPVALAAAVAAESSLAAARGVEVALPQGGTRRLLDLDAWGQLNLSLDETVALPGRIAAAAGIGADALAAIIGGYSLQGLGMAEFASRHLPGVPGGVVIGPGTMHYSWPKGATLLGIGAANLIPVPVDLDARQRVDALREQLDRCRTARRPVIQVVAVMGTTEESAIDPLEDILAAREDCRRAGMDFPVTVDAAWGGYFASLLRTSGTAPVDGDPRDVRQYTPELAMSGYVERQYRVLGNADAITIDPHKAGYIPYPAGGLCYRNADVRNLVSLKAPVVYHDGVDPTVGVYGIEGSKPGAAAAATYLSHRVISTDQTGYGKILGKSLFNSKRLYSAIVTMAADADPFIVVPLQRIPAERMGESPARIRAQLDRIRTDVVERTNDELLADRSVMGLFRELGSDLNIVAYAFNFKSAGEVNRALDKANALNNAVFTQLSLQADPGRIPATPMFVTSSQFDPASYGHELVDDFKRRLGVVGDADAPVQFVISTTMDPWLTDTAGGSFIPTLIAALRSAVLKALPAVQAPSPDAPASATRKGRP